MSDVTMIACCDEHGLHGERSECFVCGEPVEQVPMVHARESERVRRLRDGLQMVADGAGMPCDGRWLGVMARAVLEADARLAGEDSGSPGPCPRCHGRRKIDHGEMCEGTWSEGPCPVCCAPESGALCDTGEGA